MLYNKIPKLVQAGIDFLSAEEIKDDSAVEKLQFLIKKGLANSDILHVLEVYNLRQKNLADVISEWMSTIWTFLEMPPRLAMKLNQRTIHCPTFPHLYLKRTGKMCL